MTYSIPLFKLNYDEAEENAVLDVIRSKWISMGPKCTEFEQAFAETLGADHALTIANCTAALHLAFLSLDIGPEDEVLCPSLSFVATVNAIRYVGAKPVFCDIHGADNLTIDPRDIEAKITSKTKAIIVMHFGGFSCDMDRIMEIAQQQNLKVIEDACHAPLSEYNNQKLGTIGDIGCFSFFTNKNIGTGEGGMIVTNNKNLHDRIKLLRSHGMTTMSYERSKGHATQYDVIELGYNYRMDDIRAALGIEQLKKLKVDVEARQLVRKWYEDQLSEIPEITIPFEKYEAYSSNYVFTIVLNNSDVQKRDQLREYLHSNGIQTSVHYPGIHLFSIYKRYAASLPNTEYVTDNIITLPMFGTLSKDEVFFICETLKKGLNEFAK